MSFLDFAAFGHCGDNINGRYDLPDPKSKKICQIGGMVQKLWPPTGQYSHWSKLGKNRPSYVHSELFEPSPFYLVVCGLTNKASARGRLQSRFFNRSIQTIYLVEKLNVPKCSLLMVHLSILGSMTFCLRPVSEADAEGLGITFWPSPHPPDFIEIGY